jgi:hypothetical protein
VSKRLKYHRLNLSFSQIRRKQDRLQLNFGGEIAKLSPMRPKKFWAILLLVCFSSAAALEPPTKDQFEQYQRDGSLYKRILNALALGNHLVAPELVLNLKYKLSVMELLREGRSRAEIAKLLGLPPGTSNVLKSKGTPKIFVLLISFPDYPANESPYSINTKRSSAMARVNGRGKASIITIGAPRITRWTFRGRCWAGTSLSIHGLECPRRSPRAKT